MFFSGAYVGLGEKYKIYILFYKIEVEINIFSVKWIYIDYLYFVVVVVVLFSIVDVGFVIFE